MTAPPFQRIRNDYGLDWTVKFLTCFDSMLKAKDTKALYIYYLYNKTMQNTFTNLTQRQVTKILDYVDAFPYDSAQYQHRIHPNEMKQKFIKDYEDKERQEWEQLEKSLKQFQVDSTYSDSTIIYGSSGYGNSRYRTPPKKFKSKITKKQGRPYGRKTAANNNPSSLQSTHNQPSAVQNPRRPSASL